MANLISCTRRVLGPDWLEGEEQQEGYWSTLRQQLSDDASAGGWQIVAGPVERTEYDELRAEVIISVRAVVTQERGPAPA